MMTVVTDTRAGKLDDSNLADLVMGVFSDDGTGCSGEGGWEK